MAASTVVVGLALVELGARIRLRATSHRADGGIESDWFELLRSDLATPDGSADLYAPDARLFWTLRPGTEVSVTNVVYETKGEPVRWDIRINAGGQRGAPQPTPGAAAAPIVACFGDSCTFGFRVGEEETYPSQLERYLRAHGQPAAAVVNYGVPGYSSFQGRRLLEDVLARHRPDWVVLAFGANDLELDRYSDAEKAERGGPQPSTVPRWLEWSAAVKLLRGAPDRRRALELGAPEPSATRVSMDEYRANLVAMVRAARSAGARVLLLDLVFIAPLFRDTIAAVAAESGVPWIDGREVLRAGLAQLLSGERFGAERAELERFWEGVERYRHVYYDDSFYERLAADPTWRGLLRYLMVEPVHPNRLGNALIAAAAGRLILPEPPDAGDQR